MSMSETIRASVPMTIKEGLPIGVLVVARPWREDVALAAAAYLENVFGGWREPPI